MRPIHVVFACTDSLANSGLADALRSHFGRLVTVSSHEEAEVAIPRVRARFVIADLELLPLEQLRELIERFPGTVFTCVHRLADEAMWTQVLAVGAMDCCLLSNVHGILLACDRYAKSLSTAA